MVTNAYGEKGCVRDHGVRARERGLPLLAPRQLAQRIAVQQVEGAQLATGEAFCDRARVHGGSGRPGRAVAALGAAGLHGQLAQPRSRARQHAGLAQAAPVGAGGDFEQARSRRDGHLQLRGDAQQRVRGGAAALARGEALAPHDHHLARLLVAACRAGAGARLSPVAAQQLGKNAQLLRVCARAGGRLVDRLAGQRCEQCQREGRTAAGGVAQRKRGAALERARARGSDRERQALAAAPLAQPQL